MSMHSLVFGSGGQERIALLPFFGIDPERVGRYRDAWVEQREDAPDAFTLALYTRNGGGNREGYAEAIEYLHSLPGFESDEDDEFDRTYATFRFRITEQSIAILPDGVTQAEMWERLVASDPPERINMSEAWRDAIARLDKQAKG